MRRGGISAVVAAALLLVLGWGVAELYRLRVARGDVFPEYSSLRADPLGTRALHDAVGLLPGRESVRWLRPLERLDAGAGDVVLVAGLNRFRRDLDADAWAALDRAAVAGARVVVAWRAEAAEPGDGESARLIREAPWADAPVEEEKTTDQGKKAPVDGENDDEDDLEAEDKPAKASSVPDRPPPARFAGAHERRWGFRLARRELLAKVAEDFDAWRAEGAPGAWPAVLPSWGSDLFFLPRPGDGWRILYKRGGDAVFIERTRGEGSVTLLADSFLLSNEAVQRERATAVLAALLGDARRIVFVESHLGVERESGVAVLARRYGLGGAALVALVFAALWIWRRASPLAPTLPEEAEVRLALAPTAGLEALLRRAVPPAKLHAACVDAWLPGATPADRQRVTALATPADPVAGYNAATRALSRKSIS